MSTEAQLIANQRNAQKSTDPHRHNVFEIPSPALCLCAFVPQRLKKRKMQNKANLPAFGRKSETLNPKSSAGHLTAETRRMDAK